MSLEITEKAYTFPRQKLSRKEKTKEWGIQNIDYIIGLTSKNTIGSYGLTINDYQRMKINYDLYNNTINREDFTYVTNPYGIKEDFPARLNNYNIITSKIKLLEGEEIKRPFNYRVVAVNADAVSEMQEKRKELLMQYLESELEQGLMQQGVNIQNPSGEVQTPAQIQKYLDYSESDIREITANNLAKYLMNKENMEFKFNKGFKDGLITAKEIYYIGIDSNEPICQVINPLDFYFDKDPDLDFIQDSQRAAHTKYTTVSEIIDMFYEDLTEEDIDKLDKRELYSTVNVRLPEGPATGPNIPTNYSIYNLNNESNTSYVRVTRVEWKSLRKIGFLKYYDENFEEQETVVDETYKPNKEDGETIEWAWINEVWEGTKIGDDIYVKVRPKLVQFRSIDNPSECKLGFVGAVYNDRNSLPTSIIDLVKHHQYLYDIIMYRLELEIAKAKGKKMVMDIAQIPKSQGIDMEKWMYYFDTIGIAFINSFEEGKGKFVGQVPNFNQFTSIDMSLSQSVGQYIEILSKIEDMAADLMGVSKQRQGAISSSETVGGVERSVLQSSHITESLFYMHNEIKKNVLTQLIECAKVAYPEGKKINFILDDMQRIFLEVDEKFVNADYGVFVTNSARETQSLENIRALAEQAISSGMISLAEAVTIFDTNSVAEIKQTVLAAQKKVQAEKERDYQAQQEQIQAQLEGKRQLETEKADRLDQREYIKGDIQKELHAIDALSFNEDKDMNDNGILDVLELAKLSQQSIEHKDKMKMEEEKLNIQREGIKTNKQIADKKAEVDKFKAIKSAQKKPSK